MVDTGCGIREKSSPPPREGRGPGGGAGCGIREKSSPPPREGRGPGGGAGCWMQDAGCGMIEGRLPPASAETWQIFYKSVRIPFYIR